MATKVKGSPPTKEKRGTSPSQQQPAQQKSPIIQRGKSPITPKLQTTSPSPAAANRSNSTSPSGRNVPNYLKPTRKSGPESSPNPLRKNPSNETTLKPVMSRRKSLDKPLPPSNVPKTRVSAIAKDMKSQIPSSPSSARANASSSSSSKPLMGRIGKARSFSGEKESRVLHQVKKVENEAPKGMSIKETINEIVDHDNIAHIDNNDNVIDDTPQIEAIAEKVEDSDRVNEDHKDNDDIEREVIVLEDDNIVEPENEVEEVKVDESSITIPKEENENIDLAGNISEVNHEIPNEEHEESHMEELSVPDQGNENASEEKEVEEEEGGKTEVEIEAANQEKEEVTEGRDEVEIIKEPEAVKNEDEEKEVKKENGGVKKVQVVQGKREMSVVSNDVIEETATKLREQRVNRVKALAGAFETVISNQ